MGDRTIRSVVLTTFVGLLASALAQPAGDSRAQAIEGLISAGKLQAAREMLAIEVAEAGETYRTLLLQARLLFEGQRYQDALKILERCLALDDRNAEAYKLAALAAIRIDRLDIAEPALKRAVAIAPNDYLAHFHLGALYYTQNQFLAAKPELEKASELKEDYLPALVFLGLTLEEVGVAQAIIETYRRAIDASTGVTGGAEMPYLYLGRYFYRLNRFQESLPLLEKAVELNSRSAEAWLFLGKSQLALGRDKNAIAAWERSSAINPSNPEPHYLLFRLFTAQGRETEAQEQLKRFQVLKPRIKDDARRQHPTR
jgi:tetratricopeptide (TPR) repeat protein